MAVHEAGLELAEPSLELVVHAVDRRLQGRLGVLATNGEAVRENRDLDAVAVAVLSMDHFHLVRLMEVSVQPSQLLRRVLAVLDADVALGVPDQYVHLYLSLLGAGYGC